MSDSGVAADVRGIVVTVLAGAGGLLLRDVWKWAKRRRDEKRRRAELLEVLADAAQFSLDLVRSQERMTATGRMRPVSREELAQKQGNFQARRQEIARRLWEAMGNEERRGQDVIAPEDLEDDER